MDDVNLQVHKGDFLVVTGESGSGKSSLCMAMSGAIPHYFGGVMKGMVYVKGKAVTQSTIADLSKHVGTMLDDYDSQLVAMTVEEEIAFSLENMGMGAEEIAVAVDEALEKVGLAEFRERRLSDLSAVSGSAWSLPVSWQPIRKFWSSMSRHRPLTRKAPMNSMN